MKVSVIGGGTGTSVVLSGLKHYDDIEIHAIVSMMDDGGSNEVVRDQLGLLPLSDLRKALIALSKHNKDEVFRKIFTYRFPKGEGLKGHTLGNLIMVGLSEIAGSEAGAIDAVRTIFDIKGHIHPVTLDDVRLVAHYDDGSKIVGEHYIDVADQKKKIVNLSLDRKARTHKNAVKAILESDYVIIGPGDLYTSVVANLVVSGMSTALKNSKAKLIYITNLMTKSAETSGMSARDMLETIEKYVGRRMDYVLVNSSEIDKRLLSIYEKEGEHLVEDDLGKKVGKTHVVRTDLLFEEEVVVDKGDELKRSLVRHDPDKLAMELYSIFKSSTFDVLGKLLRDIGNSW